MANNESGNAAGNQGAERRGNGKRAASARVAAPATTPRSSAAAAAAEAAAKQAEEAAGRPRARSGADNSASEGDGRSERAAQNPVSRSQDALSSTPPAPGRAQDTTVRELVRASKAIALIPDPPTDAPAAVKELFVSLRAEHTSLAEESRQASDAVNRLKVALMCVDADIQRAQKSLVKAATDAERADIREQLTALSADKSEFDAALISYRAPREASSAQLVILRELATHALNLLNGGATAEEVVNAIAAKRNARAGIANPLPAHDAPRDAPSRDPDRERVAQLNIIAKLPSTLCLEPLQLTSALSSRERMWQQWGVKREYWSVALDAAIPADKRAEVSGLSATIDGLPRAGTPSPMTSA
jgi:hypothetical protein